MTNVLKRRPLLEVKLWKRLESSSLTFKVEEPLLHVVLHNWLNFSEFVIWWSMFDEWFDWWCVMGREMLFQIRFSVQDGNQFYKVAQSINIFKTFTNLLKILPQSVQGNFSWLTFGTTSDAVFSSFGFKFSSGTTFLSLGFLGLCHRLWDARFAGQLKTLSHSEQRYSMWTIRLQRCWANPNASS